MASPYSEALLARAQAYLAQPLNERRSAEGLAEVTALYAAITGYVAGTCRQCQYSDFVAVVTAYTREATRFFHPETMADSKYTFAAPFINETIVDDRYNRAVTAESLTDEDAKALLKLGGYDTIIVKKGSATAAAPDVAAEPGAEGEEEPTEREKSLQAQLNEATALATKSGEATTKAKQEAADAKKALKTEQTAHKATADELATTKQQLADTAEKLAQALKPAPAAE